MILPSANKEHHEEYFSDIGNTAAARRGTNYILCFHLLQGDFREENFNTAMSVLREAGDAGKGDQRGRRGGSKGQMLM